MPIKNFSDTVGNLTRDLPTRGAVPQHNTTGAGEKENGNVIEDKFLLAAISLFRSRLLSKLHYIRH